jgi:hypothetical protein
MADWYMHWKGVYQKRIAELQAENERLRIGLKSIRNNAPDASRGWIQVRAEQALNGKDDG